MTEHLLQVWKTNKPNLKLHETHHPGHDLKCVESLECKHACEPNNEAEKQLKKQTKQFHGQPPLAAFFFLHKKNKDNSPEQYLKGGVTYYIAGQV